MNQFKLRREIADEYGISVKVLNANIKQAELDISPRKRVSPKDCDKIYEHFGRPTPPPHGGFGQMQADKG